MKYQDYVTLPFDDPDTELLIRRRVEKVIAKGKQMGVEVYSEVHPDCGIATLQMETDDKKAWFHFQLWLER